MVAVEHPAAGVRPKPELLSVDFNERPFAVAWEITRACALACVHCRAEAQPRSQEEIQKTFDACPNGKIAILAVSDPIPNTRFAIRTEMPVLFKKAVKDALLGMGGGCSGTWGGFIFVIGDARTTRSAR